MPPSAAIVAGNSHETGGAGQFLTEFPTFCSLSSSHQIGRVRFQPVLRAQFRPVPATFWGMSKNKSCSKWGILPKLGVWACGLEFFRPLKIDQATHALPARVAARGQIGRDHFQF
ncbi:unnamed protein product [Prunus armeniaca]